MTAPDPRKALEAARLTLGDVESALIEFEVPGPTIEYVRETIAQIDAALSAIQSRPAREGVA